MIIEEVADRRMGGHSHHHRRRVMMEASLTQVLGSAGTRTAHLSTTRRGDEVDVRSVTLSLGVGSGVAWCDKDCLDIALAFSEKTGDCPLRELQCHCVSSPSISELRARV